jgi:hypothetical protein
MDPDSPGWPHPVYMVNVACPEGFWTYPPVARGLTEAALVSAAKESAVMTIGFDILYVCICELDRVLERDLRFCGVWSLFVHSLWRFIHISTPTSFLIIVVLRYFRVLRFV